MILMNHLNYKCKSVSAVVNVIEDGTCSDGMSGKNIIRRRRPHIIKLLRLNSQSNYRNIPHQCRTEVTDLGIGNFRMLFNLLHYGGYEVGEALLIIYRHMPIYILV